MKTSILISLIFFSLIGSLKSQELDPVLVFYDEVIGHNANLATDGEYIYTINGGLAKGERGEIKKYTRDGQFIEKYDIDLDMRAIMYSKKEKSLFVNSVDRNIYRIKDLPSGTFELVFEGLYENKNAGLAMGPKGKYLYYFSDGELRVIKMKTGETIKVMGGIKSGSKPATGSAVVAVDEDEHLFTWDSSTKTLYVYVLDTGEFIKEVKLNQGSFGFSLSYADGKVFVAVDGDGKTGTWYGYRIF
jgi:WD40 repeat protein